MPVKFNQYWTINEEKNGDYGQFVIKDFIPGMNRLGIQAVAGWSVLVGGYSDIILEGVGSGSKVTYSIEIKNKTVNFTQTRDGVSSKMTEYAGYNLIAD